MSNLPSTPSSVSRRDFLRGRKSPAPAVMRPPWSNEKNILSLCTRCNKCSEACPEHIIATDKSGYPEVKFDLGECTFCKECATACPEKLFNLEAPAWNNRVTVSDKCFVRSSIYCRSCGDMCQERAIHFRLLPEGKADIIIDHEKCTGCGACQHTCPANAISLQINSEYESTAND
ncbi:MAG: ferredoxin-type protein NapF [Methyloligellaceae bacterium]